MIHQDTQHGGITKPVRFRQKKVMLVLTFLKTEQRMK
jgi:hypothetical protein